MKKIQLASALSLPTADCYKIPDGADTRTSTASALSLPTAGNYNTSDATDSRTSTIPSAPAVIFDLEDYRPTLETPSNHTTLIELVAEFETDERRRKIIEEARKWSVASFYNKDVDTIRTLRLKKGWSQSRLAQEINTAQSHIARIERGTENVGINICRRLAKALCIDMNKLNEAFENQEDANIKRSRP